MSLTQISNQANKYAMTNIRLARNAYDRMRGMLGLTDSSAQNVEYVLYGCGSIHTIGMKFVLDVAFVDKSGLVVKVERCVPPNRVVFGGFCARVTVERVASLGEWLKQGEHYPINELIVERSTNETLSRVWLKRV